MSALDKLKAHMDQVVYNQGEFEPKSTKKYNDNKDVDVQEEEVTVPVKETKVITTQSAVPKAKTHTVKKGETLFSIAERYGLTVKQLQQLNKLKGNNLQVGAKLQVSK